MSVSSVQNESELLVSTASVIQVTGYGQVAAFVVLLYDYLLNLDQEVMHIWRNRLSSATVIYCMIRYGGFFSLLSVFAFATHPSLEFCRAYLSIQAWPVCLIRWFIQIVLQMRLFALYNRSKKVLAMMVTCFIAEVVALTTVLIITDVHLQATNEPLPGVYLCGGTYSSKVLSDVWWAQIVFEIFLCGLAIYNAIKRLKEGYRVQPLSGRTIVDALITGNVSYFIIILILSTVGAIMLKIDVQWMEFLEGFLQSLEVIAGSRLILHIRDVADRQSYGATVATLSLPVFNIPMSTVASDGKAR